MEVRGQSLGLGPGGELKVSGLSISKYSYSLNHFAGHDLYTYAEELCAL